MIRMTRFRRTSGEREELPELLSGRNIRYVADCIQDSKGCTSIVDYLVSEETSKVVVIGPWLYSF